MRLLSKGIPTCGVDAPFTVCHPANHDRGVSSGRPESSVRRIRRDAIHLLVGLDQRFQLRPAQPLLSKPRAIYEFHHHSRRAGIGVVVKRPWGEVIAMRRKPCQRMPFSSGALTCIYSVELYAECRAAVLEGKDGVVPPAI